MITIQADLANKSPEEAMKALGGRLMTPETAAHVEQLAKKMRYSKKNRQAQKHIALFEALDMLEERPDMPLNELLATLIMGFPLDIPSDFLLEMVEYIIAEWERFTQLQKKKIEQPELSLAC